MSYIIEMDGTIISQRTGRPISKKKINGKWSVKMWGSTRYVHRIVFEKFCCPVSKSQYVDFKDGNPDNYHFNNLVLKNKFELYDEFRFDHEYPYVTVKRGVNLFNLSFIYKNKLIKSESYYKERLDFEVETFYRRHVLSYLAENVYDKNSCIPMYGNEDNYLVYNNRGHNVFYNRKTRKWKEVSGDSVRLIGPDGKRKVYHAATVVWNSFNPNDIAKEARLRVDNGRFFDLIKIC